MKQNTNLQFTKTLIESILEKKGEEITEINLSKLGNTIVDRFFICHGNSTTQVEAIADNIEEKLHQHLSIHAKNIEGKQNAQWILLDYYDVIVHVFYEPVRRIYNLESLWADGEIVNHKS
ncbi:MAG TPA: ribosome silencing factor [Salinivirgaceae bacterium]|nr:ribosome silencing factor [Salinivirgaceae bacterium]